MNRDREGALLARRPWECVSGSTLKTLAVVSMFIDHLAAAVIYYLIRYEALPAGTDVDAVIQLYYVMRGIGRTAFPIYCFLLVEGFVHTSRVSRYILRIFIFACISELPFDLAFFQKSAIGSADLGLVLRAHRETFAEHQNVFWTLLIGLIMLWAIDRLREWLSGHLPVMVLFSVLVAAAACAAAELACTDYGGWGVGLILILYCLRGYRLPAAAAGYVLMLQLYSEAWSFPGFILMLIYNGERGYVRRAGKYFFYAFYPAHLILLYRLRCAII